MPDWITSSLLLAIYGIISGAIGGLLSQYLFPKWLQEKKHSLERENETHKLQLKRKELMFQRELEAADAYMSLYRKLWPQYSIPDMEWDDACNQVAFELGKYEKALEDYLEQHSIGIDEDARAMIESAANSAAADKFVEESDYENQANAIALRTAGRVLDTLQETRSRILADLKNGPSQSTQIAKK